MEFLEKRLAPAGLVTAILTGGGLKLTGDDLGNEVSLTEVAPDSYQLTGLNGTQIRINGTDSAGPITFTGLTKSIEMDMKGGADVVALEDLTFDGKVTLKLGDGANQVTLGGLDIDGALSITGGKDADEILSGSTGIRIGGATTLALGDGNNVTSLSVGDRLIFGGAFSYTGGKGADEISLAGSHLLFGAGLQVKAGAGSGDLYFNATESLRVTGAAAYECGPGGSASVFSITAKEAFFGGALTVKHGAASNETKAVVTGAFSVGGSLSISVGKGGVSNLVSQQAAAISIGGSLTVANDAGQHETVIQGAVTVDGAVTVTNGNNTASSATTTRFTGSLLEVGGGLTITNKTGGYTTAIQADEVDVAGKITISNGGTGKAPTTVLTTTQLRPEFDSPERTLSAGGISINNGAGNFNNLLFYADAHIGGSVVIKNGDSSPEKDAISAGMTMNSFKGSWHVQGNVSITNGNGRFANGIDDWDFGVLQSNRFYTGGNVSVTNGNVSLGYNVFLVEEFNAAKGLTIKNGNISATGGVTNKVDAAKFRTGGALSITNGNSSVNGTAFANYIGATASLDVGSVMIKNGDGIGNTEFVAPVISVRGAVSLAGGTKGTGTNVFTIDATSKAVFGGALSVTTIGGVTSIDAPDLHFGGKVNLTFGGTGADLIAIGGNSASFFAAGGLTIKANGGNNMLWIGGSTVTDLAILGGVSYSGGDGTDTVSVQGAGRVAGGVSASFGKGASNSLSLMGADAMNVLNVVGAVNVTADASASRGIYLVDAALAALSFTGGNVTDEVNMVGSSIRGAVTVDMKTGDDFIYLNDTTIRGATTVNMGAGNDAIYVEGLNIYPGVTTFGGAVKLNMGDGDDELWVVETNHAALSAVFQSSATFDGGAGTDALHEGAAITYAEPRVAKGFAP